MSEHKPISMPALGKDFPRSPFNLAERMVHAAKEVAQEGDVIVAARQPRLDLQHELVPQISTPESPVVLVAEFLPSAKKFFENCGLDPTRINPIPLGEGFTHVVFSYTSPEGRAQVVKVSKPATEGLMNHGRRDESENINLITKYFGAFAVPTEIRSDPATGKYLIIQDMVPGRAVNNASQTPEIHAQLEELMRCNRRLMKDTGNSMDFIGIPGFFSWARHQVRKFFEKKSVFDISNLLLDAEGKIRIIDYDMLRFRNVTPKQAIISRLGFNANRFVMKTYFNLDMKPKV